MAANSKITTYNFSSHDSARQAMKHIVDAYPAEGYTSSDAEGNPSPELPITNLTGDRLIANITLSSVGSSEHIIKVTFEPNAPTIDSELLIKVLNKLTESWRIKDGRQPGN